MSPWVVFRRHTENWFEELTGSWIHYYDLPCAQLLTWHDIRGFRPLQCWREALNISLSTTRDQFIFVHEFEHIFHPVVLYSLRSITLLVNKCGKGRYTGFFSRRNRLLVSSCHFFLQLTCTNIPWVTLKSGWDGQILARTWKLLHYDRTSVWCFEAWGTFIRAGAFSQLYVW